MTARRKFHIAIDLDGIVADLHSKWLELYNNEYGHGATLDDFKHWNAVKNFKIGGKIYDYLRVPGLYRSLEPLAGACDALDLLRREGHFIHIISATVDSQAAADKLWWCGAYLPRLDPKQLTISNQKHRFISDVFIDDGPKNIRAHAEAQPNAVRMGIAWPYNAEVSHLMHLRAESYRDTLGAWAHMLEFIAEKSA